MLEREIDMHDNFAEDPFGPSINDPIRWTKLQIRQPEVQHHLCMLLGDLISGILAMDVFYEDLWFLRSFFLYH